MRRFINLTESIHTPADFWDDSFHSWDDEHLQYFREHFAGKVFRTEKEARDFIFAALRRLNQSSLIPDKGENERRMADAAPIYHDGEGYRIGMKDYQPKITWHEIEIRPESHRYIVDSAEAQGTDVDIDFKPKFYRITDILPPKSEDGMYMGDSREVKRIESLAREIMEGGWFTPIIVGITMDDDGLPEEQYVVEGQHRARAALYYLGLKEVPAYTVTIWD